MKYTTVVEVFPKLHNLTKRTVAIKEKSTSSSVKRKGFAHSFLQLHSVVHRVFLPEGRRVNKVNSSNASFARYHCFREFLTKNCTVGILQPSYSPNLAPVTFQFPKFEGRRFDTHFLSIAVISAIEINISVFGHSDALGDLCDISRPSWIELKEKSVAV